MLQTPIFEPLFILNHITMMFQFVTKTVLSIFSSLWIISITQAQIWTPEKKQQIAQYMQSIKSDTAGLAIGVVYNGKIVYEQYMGLANLEHQAKVFEKTRFNIASNAKQFTALCILKLATEGKLSVKDDIRKYLPKLYPNIATPITLEQLLNHTSGIRTSEELLDLQNKVWWKEVGFSNRDVLRLTEKQKTLNFTPGAEHLYSNTNYILLAEVVKKVTKKKFSQYAKKLFEDLGMKQTLFKTRYMAVIPHKANPYGKWGKNWVVEPSLYKNHGDGNLYTTLLDQLRWEQLIQKPSLLPQWSKIIQKSQLPIEASKYRKYGYGLMFGTYKGVPYRYHYGQTAAYGATFLRFPKQGVAIVAMGNNRNLADEQVADKLATIILGKEVAKKQSFDAQPKKVASKRNTLKSLEGYYKGMTYGLIIRIKAKGNQLYREMYQRDPVEMIHEKGDLYRYSNSDILRMYFSSNKGKSTQFTLYHPEIAPRVFKKLPEFKPTKAYLQAIQGKFYNDELGVYLNLKYLKDDQVEVKTANDQYNATLIYKDNLRAGGYQVNLVWGKDNQLQELRLKSGRIKNVKFVRVN
ncbi:hypothetical protein BKI52_01765 [marine bacterium AO1-C]|nr:hypothetical protein BKI52_01765 [marine bacterium AO1-C]